MERNVRGGVYVLSADPDLRREVETGLNRRSYSITRAERDFDDVSDDPWAREVEAIRRSRMIIVLATRELARRRKCRELLDIPNENYANRRIVRMIIVPVEPALDPFKNPKSPFRKWSFSGGFVNYSKSGKRLLDGLDSRLKRLWIRGNRKPSGARRVYVVLSYGVKDRKRLYALHDALEEMGIGIWDYGLSPRDTNRDFQEEIDEAILHPKAKATLFLHTAAWENSKECRREHRVAKRAGNKRIWLRYGRSKVPPRRHGKDEVIDIYRDGPEKGFRDLERLLFPSRRELKTERP